MITCGQDQVLPGHFVEGEVRRRTVCGRWGAQTEPHSSWRRHNNVSVGSVDPKWNTPDFMRASSVAVLKHFFCPWLSDANSWLERDTLCTFCLLLLWSFMFYSNLFIMFYSNLSHCVLTVSYYSRSRIISRSQQKSKPIRVSDRVRRRCCALVLYGPVGSCIKAETELGDMWGRIYLLFNKSLGHLPCWSEHKSKQDTPQTIRASLWQLLNRPCGAFWPKTSTILQPNKRDYQLYFHY